MVNSQLPDRSNPEPIHLVCLETQYRWRCIFFPLRSPTGYPSSAWRLDSLGAKGTLPRKTRIDDAPPLGKQTSFELTYQRTSPFPAGDVVLTSSASQGSCWQSKLLRLPMMSFAPEADRHKRDSGVIDVEDGSDIGGSPVCAGPAAPSEDQLATARGTGPGSVYAWRGNS